MLDFLPTKPTRKQKTQIKKILNDEIEAALRVRNSLTKGSEGYKIANNYQRRMKLKLKELS